MNLDVLFTTLRTVLEFLFRVGKSPTVASELVEILNGTLERAIQAQSESKWIFLHSSDQKETHMD